MGASEAPLGASAWGRVTRNDGSPGFAAQGFRGGEQTQLTEPHQRQTEK